MVWIDPYVTRLSLRDLLARRVVPASQPAIRSRTRSHDRGVDLFLCGISGRRFAPRYIERIVRVLQPARILPTHHDDLFRPLDTPARFSFNVNLTGFADEVRRASRDLPIATLEVGARIT